MSNSKRNICFIAIFQILALTSCASTKTLNPKGSEVALLEAAPPFDCKPVKTFTEKRRRHRTNELSLAEINHIRNESAEIGATHVWVRGLEGDGILAEAVECPQSLADCEIGHNAKACFDYGKLLLVNSSLNNPYDYFQKSCELGLESSCRETDHYIVSSMDRCEGNIEECRKIVKKAIEWHFPFSKYRPFIVRACGLGSEDDCQDLAFFDLIAGCGKTDVTSCVKLGDTASKKNLLEIAIQAYQQACLHGSKTACAKHQIISHQISEDHYQRMIARQKEMQSAQNQAIRLQSERLDAAERKHKEDIDGIGYSMYWLYTNPGLLK